jgi:hypothetical protein
MKLSPSLCSAAALVLALTVMPGFAEAAKCFKGVSAKTTVNCDPEHAWHAIRSLRNEDPQDVKTISQSPAEDILEETFDDLPVIGKATCRYKETYKPYERIDYSLINSDHFKAFEGSWVLTPTREGQTIVELSSYIDTGLTIPFAHQITNMATMHNVRRRLEEVKKVAESRKTANSKRSNSEVAQ